MELGKLVDLGAVEVPCPGCGTALTPLSVCVAGLAIVVDARCSGCGGTFAFDWPAGHALLHPVMVDRRTGAVHAGGSVWYARRFVECLGSRDAPASFEIAIRGECRDGGTAVLVNCLDFVYSHVLLKLLSAARHLRESPEADVVVIVPTWLEWLAPPEALVIAVDLPLARGAEWVDGLDAAVDRALAPSSSVRISPAVSQPDLTLGELGLLGADLTPGPPDPNGAAPLQIGLSLREDRLWLGPPPRLWLRAARKLLPARLAQELLLRRQHRNYATLARRMRERHPTARFVAFGLGQPRGLPDFVDDVRTGGATREELAWLDDYRRCRVVIGVHGANLLLPSLLAGAVVDLLPRHKLPNVNQDLIIPCETAPEPKLTLYRYRILPEECTPDTVAAIALSLIEDADFHRQNMVENRRAYEAPGWPRPIHWRQIRL